MGPFRSPELPGLLMLEKLHHDLMYLEAQTITRFERLCPRTLLQLANKTRNESCILALSTVLLTS